MRDTFDLIKEYNNRVKVGMSITGLKEHEKVIQVIEPNASSVSERIKVMREAKRRGFRTQAVFGPILPGLFRDADHLAELFKLAGAWNAEEIRFEPVNARLRSLIYCEESLREAGFETAAKAVGAIRNQRAWAEYAMKLTQDIQKAARDCGLMNKLKILLFQKTLSKYVDITEEIERDLEGVAWKDPE